MLNPDAHGRDLLVSAQTGSGKTVAFGIAIAPDLLAGDGLVMGEPRGIAWSPLSGLHLSADMALNFIVTARRA